MGVAQVIEAIPTIASGDEPNGDLLRTALVSGFVGFIAGDTAVVDGILQVDPADAELGGVCQAYIYGTDAGAFVFDVTDETTAHDGIFCLVLIGGRRYKRVGRPALATVKSRSVETPPDPNDADPSARPAYGDSYLYLTGSWGTEGISVNSVAVWSSLGGGSWQEIAPDFGPPVYVQDEGGYIHWDGDAGWLNGVGPNSVEPKSIPLSAIIGTAGSLTIRVQNQTTNSPPGSAAVGDAYIIGSNPSAAWAGNAAKVAICEVADSFTIYSPQPGDEVYDIALGQRYSWRGTAWKKSSGDFTNITTTYVTPGLSTWTKSDGSIGVLVKGVGAGGGGAGNGNSNGASGGNTSFGSYVQAPPGGGGVRGSAGGVNGSGGAAPIADIGMAGLSASSGGNSPGSLGSIVDPAHHYGLGGAGESPGGGGGGGAAFEHWLDADEITDTVQIAIGPGGAGADGGLQGGSGKIVVQEYVRT